MASGSTISTNWATGTSTKLTRSESAWPSAWRGSADTSAATPSSSGNAAMTADAARSTGRSHGAGRPCAANTRASHSYRPVAQRRSRPARAARTSSRLAGWWLNRIRLSRNDPSGSSATKYSESAISTAAAVALPTVNFCRPSTSPPVSTVTAAPARSAMAWLAWSSSAGASARTKFDTISEQASAAPRNQTV